MLLLIKCPEKSTQGRPQKGVRESRLFPFLSSFLSLFLLFYLSWFEVTWVCNWACVLSSFSTLRLSVSWAPCFSSVLASQSLNAGVVRCLSSFLPYGSLSFGPLPLSFASPSLLSLSAVLSLVIWSFPEVTEFCLSSHLIYLLHFPTCHLLV